MQFHEVNWKGKLESKQCDTCMNGGEITINGSLKYPTTNTAFKSNFPGIFSATWDTAIGKFFEAAGFLLGAES